MGGRNALTLLYADRSEAARMGRGKRLTRALGSVPAAIRIPEHVTAQLAIPFPVPAPQLFVHEGARQALERRLMAAFPGPVVLSITDNRHSIISHRCVDGVLRARIHHMFLDAPTYVAEALARYLAQGDREASQIVGAYIETHAPARLAPRSRHVQLHTKGKHHDLLGIFDEVNARWLGGGVNCLITWGKRGRARRIDPRATIKLGSYSASERLIRIHPALDRHWVPRYFLAYIVYHEMLHHVIPASRAGGARTLLHPPEFVAREKQFRHYERAIAWERAHIGRLLRS